jgi:biopolymer transport protein ExbD
MRRAGRGANIDVTPLIDILFMLIIFFYFNDCRNAVAEKSDPDR